MKRVDQLGIPPRRAFVRDLVQAVLAAAFGGSHLEEAFGRGVQGQQHVPEVLGGFFDHAEVGSIARPGPAGGQGEAAYVLKDLGTIQIARHGHALCSSLFAEAIIGSISGDRATVTYMLKTNAFVQFPLVNTVIRKTRGTVVSANRVKSRLTSLIPRSKLVEARRPISPRAIAP